MPCGARCKRRDEDRTAFVSLRLSRSADPHCEAPHETRVLVIAGGRGILRHAWPPVADGQPRSLAVRSIASILTPEKRDERAAIPFLFLWASAAATGAWAQSAATPSSTSTPSTRASSSASAKSGDQQEVRPDARYAKPSGQDSRPSVTKVPKAAPPSPRPKDPTSQNPAQSQNAAGPPTQGGSRAYTGATGRKADPSTACSTARTTKDGRLDCGTGGDAATTGRIVKKGK